MVIRTLTASDFDAVHAAFNEAFSDYVVPFSLTATQLREMLTRRGWVPEASVAIEEDARIVAFTLNGVEGNVAYDSGTGVIPSHRRRGLSAKVMRECERVLRERGCDTYILEVIDTNEKAIALYESLGFRETRALQCWLYESPSNSALTSDKVNLRPSWQNSDTSIARANDRHVRIGDAENHLILFPSSGDVPRFRGIITTALLDDALSLAGRPLRMLNLDEGETAFARFLEDAGARRIVRQREMAKAL
jgi:ribosomal protein S18 acetylase RimI-like enzyme